MLVEELKSRGKSHDVIVQYFATMKDSGLQVQVGEEIHSFSSLLTIVWLFHYGKVAHRGFMLGAVFNVVILLVAINPDVLVAIVAIAC